VLYIFQNINVVYYLELFTPDIPSNFSYQRVLQYLIGSEAVLPAFFKDKIGHGIVHLLFFI